MKATEYKVVIEYRGRRTIRFVGHLENFKKECQRNHWAIVEVTERQVEEIDAGVRLHRKGDA
jgi:hypothetical protein